MKKITFILVLLTPFFVLMSQTIDFKKNGEYYYAVSPNGRYYAGAVDASYAHFYDVEEKRSVDLAPLDMRGYKVSSINNQGQVAGANEMQAGIWEQGGEWLILPLPEEATEDEKLWYEATGISENGDFVVGTLGEFPTRIVLWTKSEEGIYTVETLPVPDRDPIYNDRPQFFQTRSMSADGSRFLVRWRISDGHVEFPLVYTKKDDGSWSYRFIDADFVINEGAVIPKYPNVEGLDFETADSLITDYIIKLNEAESGYYPRLDGSAISSNGKYISCKMGYQERNSDYGVFYGAVYDIENDSTIVFTKVRDASCMSVDNAGNVSLCTPSTEYFRWSFISNVKTPNEVQTLTEWTKMKTNGAIDLSEYMMYAIDESGSLNLAEGTTYLASEGTAYLTYQTNLMETGLTESFFVQFGDATSIDDIELGSLAVYPNPTTGLLYGLDGVSDVEIYDMMGRKVYSQSIVESTIDLSHLVSGNYCILVSKNGKLIKSNVIIY